MKQKPNWTWPKAIYSFYNWILYMCHLILFVKVIFHLLLFPVNSITWMPMHLEFIRSIWSYSKEKVYARKAFNVLKFIVKKRRRGIIKVEKSTSKWIFQRNFKFKDFRFSHFKLTEKMVRHHSFELNRKKKSEYRSWCSIFKFSNIESHLYLLQSQIWFIAVNQLLCFAIP